MLFGPAQLGWDQLFVRYRSPDETFRKHFRVEGTPTGPVDASDVTDRSLPTPPPKVTFRERARAARERQQQFLDSCNSLFAPDFVAFLLNELPARTAIDVVAGDLCVTSNLEAASGFRRGASPVDATTFVEVSELTARVVSYIER